MVITRRAHMLLACAVYHLKALTEEMAVPKNLHCLFCTLFPKGLPGISLIFFALFWPWLLNHKC